MALLLKNGVTSKIIRFVLKNSTSGQALTGLTSASAGLIISTAADNEATATAYTQSGSTIEAVSVLGTYSAPTATKCRFSEYDSVNHPGLYEFQFADARFAVSSAKSLVISVNGATNLLGTDYEVEFDPQVDAIKILGTAISTPATAGVLDVNVKNLNNVAATSITTVNANIGSTQPLNFTGTAGSALVKGDTVDIAGAAVSTTTAQIGVNAVQINAVATTSVTAVNANVGTTQPTNFTGTAASALVKSDMVDVAGAAVSTSTAQIGVNAVNIGGTAQTGRDIGASVLLSTGTGTGQLDFTSGVVKANLAQILGTALTETAGLIAGAFKKFFNVATPTGTVNSIPDAVAGATGGIFIAGTNAATTVTTSLTTTFTGNLTGSVASVTGAVGSVTGAVGSVTGAVASVTGNVGGNVLGSVASVTGLTASNLDTTVSSRLAPTVASRTLDVSTTGEAGLDFDNIKDATGSHTLTNIRIPNVTLTDTATTLTNGVTVTTNSDKTGYSLASGQIAIKKNTALSNFEFLMVSSTDHISGKTGLTITSTRSIDGGVFAATSNSATEISSGIYKISLSSSDLNGDVITFRFTGTGADDSFITMVTQS